MIKVICMFALVGLAAAAPQSRSLPAAQDQEAVISTIMSSLQPAIDAAIARALGENSVTTITVEGTYGIPDELSGSFTSVQSNSNYVSGAAYHDTGYPHQHDGNSQQQNSVGLANYGVSDSFSNEKSAYGSGATLVSTAGVNGVVYGESQVSDAVTATIDNVNVQNVQTQVQQTEASLSKAAQSQKLVSSVLNALAPSVEAAVQRALMAMMQQNTAAVSTVSTTQTSSSSFSASQEQTLVTKIIEVLTPSIATSVRKALAARYEAEQAAAAAAIAEQQAAQQAAAQLAAEQAAAQQAAAQQAAAQLAAQQFAAQQAAAQQAAAQQAAAQQAAALAAEQQSQSALISQIISALKPSIASSVSSALQAQSFSQQQQSQANSFSQQQSSQAFNSQSSSASSSSLGNIFGDGSAHNVKIETPDYKIEYNN